MIYSDFNKENDKKNAKFRICDIVRTTKYKNNFVKVYTRNWSEETVVIKKVKDTAMWTYVINDLIGEKTIGSFHDQELQK